MNNSLHSDFPGPAAGPALLPRPPGRRRGSASTGARALSSFLLATVLSILIVLADRLVDAWSDGHLAVAVLVLWMVLFVGLAVFARSTRRLAIMVAGAYRSWVELGAQERIGADPMAPGAAGTDGQPGRTLQGQAYLTPHHLAGKVFYRPW